MSGKFQREVRLYGGVDFRWAAEINVPAPIFKLPPADMLCEFFDAFVVEPAENMKIENVIGFEGCIGLELSQPIAVLVLQVC